MWGQLGQDYNESQRARHGEVFGDPDLRERMEAIMASAAIRPSGCRVDLSGGQVALVTGASRGSVGRSPRGVAACGAGVAGVARDRGGGGLEETLKAIREHWGTAEDTPPTWPIPPTSTGLSQAVEERDSARFQILVDNAGITRDSLFLRMDDDAWGRRFSNERNLKRTFLFFEGRRAIMM